MKKFILRIIFSIAVMGIVISYQPVGSMGVVFDCSLVSDVPQEECEALVSLYANTTGAGWTNQDNWLVTQAINTTVGDWYGVTVSNGHVTSLDLSNNNLIGPLLVELENLNNLTTLDLGNNQLSGVIPNSLGNLSDLDYLSLWGNQLTGDIPASLGNLNNLQRLILHHNQLSGNIPESLGNLNNLANLILNRNQLTGAIPQSLGNLNNLKYLRLDINQLTGSIPASIGNPPNLRWIILSHNHLTGNIPASLGSPIYLNKLLLDFNKLSGSIPGSIGNLIYLNDLYLNDNQLSGEIPATLTNLEHLCLPTTEGCAGYGLNLNYNRFKIPTAEPLASFLALKNPGWDLTQRETTFEDAPLTHWAYDWIDRLYYAGVTSGCSQSPPMYCPEQSVTRAEMAKFLLKGIHGEAFTAPAVGTHTGFYDVPINFWAAHWIKQLSAEGITSGCGDCNYCPNANVTRAEMAKFLLTAKHGAGYTPPPVGTDSGFTDVPKTYWAAAWIKQLATDGITSGCGFGNYCPNYEVTRAEMAKFLVLTFNLP